MEFMRLHFVLSRTPRLKSERKNHAISVFDYILGTRFGFFLTPLISDTDDVVIV